MRKKGFEISSCLGRFVKRMLTVCPRSGAFDLSPLQRTTNHSFHASPRYKIDCNNYAQVTLPNVCFMFDKKVSHKSWIVIMKYLHSYIINYSGGRTSFYCFKWERVLSAIRHRIYSWEIGWWCFIQALYSLIALTSGIPVDFYPYRKR